MTLILSALAVAFAAFCVWLTVRIVNRKERWAKWTAAVVIGLPALYGLSFGPACWVTSYVGGDKLVSAVYRPILRMSLIRNVPLHYSRFGAAKKWRWVEYRADKDWQSRWHWTDIDLSGY